MWMISAVTRSLQDAERMTRTETLSDEVICLNVPRDSMGLTQVLFPSLSLEH